MSVSFAHQSSESVLFITIDSCRFDTFMSATVPNMKALGKLHKTNAPGNFTYASHMAMFMGFTPGNAKLAEPWVNPKYAKIFRMTQGGILGKAKEHFLLEGRNIIDGFKRKGYRTLGAAAVNWFNPATETAKALIGDFDQFYFAPNTWSLDLQLNWLAERLNGADQPVFAFLNIGETHVPYYFEGAEWSAEDNPCIPFGKNNDAEKARIRQRAALEFVDNRIKLLLDAFASATTVICADHGDCWGEDGLWEHGISHEKVLEVPLLFRLANHGD